MSLLMVVVISVMALVLFGAGVYIVLQKRRDDGQPTSTIKESGAYSIIRNSPAESVRQTKASPAAVLSFLDSAHPDISLEERMRLTQQWESSIQASILTIEDGDQQGFSTYSFDLSDKDLQVCSFLHKDSYITREMIFNHSELLPPFYIGCTARLISREAWNNQDKSGWIPVLPVEGAYQVPDWRHIEIQAS
jgi:hypothetical protein